jgi:hypothetical protein
MWPPPKAVIEEIILYVSAVRYLRIRGDTVVLECLEQPELAPKIVLYLKQKKQWQLDKSHMKEWDLFLHLIAGLFKMKTGRELPVRATGPIVDNLKEYAPKLDEWLRVVDRNIYGTQPTMPKKRVPDWRVPQFGDSVKKSVRKRRGAILSGKLRPLELDEFTHISWWLSEFIKTLERKPSNDGRVS